MSEPDLHAILGGARTIAVVGLSKSPDRPSNEVAAYLKRQGYRVVPINPAHAGERILDELCYASLGEAARALAQQGVRIDVVDCFRKPEAIEPIAQEAADIGATTLWMQLGVINESAARRAREAGLSVVMDRCMKLEHMSHLG